MNSIRAVRSLREDILIAVRNKLLYKGNNLFLLEPKITISGKLLKIEYGVNPWFKKMRLLHAPGNEEVMTWEELSTDPYGLAEQIYYWTVLTNEDLAFGIVNKLNKVGQKVYRDGSILNQIINTPELRLYRGEEMPDYIRVFSNVIKKRFRRSLMFVNERLPLGPVSILVTKSFDTKKEKKAALKLIAGNIVKSDDENLSVKIEDIMSDEKKSFYTKLDELINLSSQISGEPDYSYCLCCGERIKRTSKFCDATKREQVEVKEDKDNCLRIFKAWIKTRLGIIDIKQSREKREQLYKEMQALVKKYRISAFEQFKNNHPEIFTPRKRGRKEKIKSD